MAEERFYVAGIKPGQAYAVRVAEGSKTDIAAFYREHAGANIQLVGRDEMQRMLRAYIRERDEVKS